MQDNIRWFLTKFISCSGIDCRYLAINRLGQIEVKEYRLASHITASEYCILATPISTYTQGRSGAQIVTLAAQLLSWRLWTPIQATTLLAPKTKLAPASNLPGHR